MDDKAVIDQIVTYCLVFALATFAGVVKAIRKFRKSGGAMTVKTILAKASGDIVIAIFAGLMMFFWLLGDKTSMTLSGRSAVYISIAAYMGAQAIDIFVVMWNAAHKSTNK